MEALEAFARDRAHAPDVAQCVQAVVRELEPISVSRHIALSLLPDVDLTRVWQVVGEASRLKRVIFNLVENAIRHSPAGASVTVALEQSGAEILLTVDDQGPGVPPNLRDTLFEKFTQGMSHQGKGGLGLYFCRMTVERWGGAIGCTPRPEGGTRFWFRLPEPTKD